MLVAQAPGESPQRRWSIEGAEFRELADACDPYEDRFVQLIRRDGMPSAALIQSCRQAQLVELPSGQVRWTRPTAGAMAMLREIDPLDIGTPFPWQAVVLPNRNSKGQRSIRLFSVDGQATEGPPLPADLAGVVAVPGGLILTRADGVQMVRHSGQAVWELAGARYNSLRSGDYFLVQQGDPKTGPQVVIEIASGRAFLVSHGPLRPLEQPISARGLWLSVLDNPRTLVAWDLTEAAN